MISLLPWFGVLTLGNCAQQNKVRAGFLDLPVFSRDSCRSARLEMMQLPIGQAQPSLLVATYPAQVELFSQ